MSTSYTRLARPNAKPTVCLSRVEKSTQLPILALIQIIQPCPHLPLQWRHAEQSKFLDYVLQDYPLGDSRGVGVGHCGIAAQAHAARTCPYNGGMQRNQSSWITFYKIIRWVILAVLVLVIVVSLRKPTPPALPIAAETAKEDLRTFDEKVDRLAESHARGEPGEARFTGDEINSAIAHSLGTDAVTPQATQAQTSAPAGTAAPPEIRTVQVGFFDDQVTGQFATPIYGKEVYITDR